MEEISSMRSLMREKKKNIVSVEGSEWGSNAMGLWWPDTILWAELTICYEDFVWPFEFPLSLA